MTEGKGEIARDKQFLLFPQSFQPILRFFCHFHQILKLSSAKSLLWKCRKFDILERLNTLPNNKILDLTKFKILTESDDKLNVFEMVLSVIDKAENIVEEGRILVTSISTFSHTIFSIHPETSLIFESNLSWLLQMLSNWISLRFCGLVKG